MSIRQVSAAEQAIETGSQENMAGPAERDLEPAGRAKEETKPFTLV